MATGQVMVFNYKGHVETDGWRFRAAGTVVLREHPELAPIELWGEWRLREEDARRDLAMMREHVEDACRQGLAPVGGRVAYVRDNLAARGEPS